MRTFSSMLAGSPSCAAAVSISPNRRRFAPPQPRAHRPFESAPVLRPSQESFEELAKRGNWVPVVREILADMDTPLSLFHAAIHAATYHLLLRRHAADPLV